MHITTYTDSLPPNVGGCADYFVVRIRPKYRNDTGIHAHEAEHVRQWWMGVLVGVLVAILLAWTKWPDFVPAAAISGIGLHPLAYLLLPRYRLWAEVRGYRIQLRHYPDDRTALFAGFISERYNLTISRAEAATTLKG